MEQKIDLTMLSRIDSEQKATASELDDIEKSLHGLEREVSEIKGAIRPTTPWWITHVVAPVCVAAILATAGAVVHLEIVVHGVEKNVVGVQASLASQNLTTHAALPAGEFKATLADLTSSIALARKHNVKVPSKVLDDLSKQLNATETSTSGFWPAAAQLISYRSALTHDDIARLKTSLPRCVDLKPHPATTAEAISPGEQTVKINPAYYENCQIQLDSPEEDAKISSFAQRNPALTLRHCLVIYSGGEVRLQLGLWPLMFENCLWEFSVSGTPPPSGQKVTETLLASNPDSFKFPAL